MRKLLLFCDFLWRWPSEKVGKFLWYLTGCSTVSIGFVMFAGGACCRTILDALQRDWGWLILGALVNIFIVFSWMHTFIAMHDQEINDDDSLPIEYCSMYSFRLILAPLYGILVVWGLASSSWFLSICNTIHFMGIYVAMMMWPKQKSIVRQWLENRALHRDVAHAS